MGENHDLHYFKEGFTQFVVDNMNNKTDPSDGKGTFHRVDIITC